MLAALFALAGCFESAIHGWRHCNPERSSEDVPDVVACAGIGALQLAHTVVENGDSKALDCSSIEATMGLVWRAVVLLVTLLGLVTIARWLP
jgi:membrane protein required for beta-lactamase induction